MMHRVGWKILGYHEYVAAIEPWEIPLFFNDCRYVHIELAGVALTPGKIRFFCRRQDAAEVESLLEKHGGQVERSEKKGLYYGLRYLWRCNHLCLGILCFLLTMAGLGQRIWQIEFQGNSRYSKESLLAGLDDMDVYVGQRAGRIACQELEMELQRKHKNITWVSVQVRGSRLDVSIREKKVIPTTEPETPADLVASQDGVIRSMVVAQGKGMVGVGDTVKKGQVLIAGKWEQMDENDTVKKVHKVRAQGTVVIQGTFSYDCSLARRQSLYQWGSHRQTIWQIRIGKMQMFVYNPLKHLERNGKCDIIREGGSLYPCGLRRFPVQVYRKTLQEKCRKDITYSEKEARQILTRRADHVLGRHRKKKGWYAMEYKPVFRLTQGKYCYTVSGTFLQRQTRIKETD